MINDLGYRNKVDVNSLINYLGENDACSKVQSLEEILNSIFENNVEDVVNTTPLEPITLKEALKASKTFSNFFDAPRKIRDELQKDLNFTKK